MQHKRQNAEDRGPQSPALDSSQDWQTGDLQPPGLLNHAATHGRFSLESVLNSAHPDERGALMRQSSFPPDDPIQNGLVNVQIAASLFDR